MWMLKRKKGKSYLFCKNEKIKLFIFICVLNFLFLGLIFVLLNVKPIIESNLEIQDSATYELVKEGESSDPFITRNPYARERITEPIIHGNDPSLGVRDASVNMIFFSDFDCKFCKKQFQILREVLGEYEKDLRIIWKDYPNLDSSSQSWQSSIAGRCAYEQDKFWQYYDVLVEQEGTLEGEDYVKMAKDLKLDTGDFKDCLKGDEAKMKVEDNVYEADSLQIVGVPYLFVNDKEILGEITKREIVQMIDSELEKNKED